MPIETYWAVRAEILQALPAFRSSVKADKDDLLYLDGNAQVWRDPAGRSRPLYRDDSQEWRAHCEQIISKKANSSPAPLKHRWNHRFEWRRAKAPFRMLSEAQANEYDEKGWVVLEDAVDSKTVERLIEEVDVAEREGEEKLKQMRGGRGFIARAGEITFTTHLVNRSPFVREFYSTRLFTNVCHDLIGPDVRLYWDQAVYKKPGVSKPFPWHQDNGYTFVEPQQYLTFWIGLNEANEENGCMWMVPGIHKLGTIAHDLTDLGYACHKADPPQAVPVPTRPGTVIVLSSVTPHKTEGNKTSQVRRALVAQYVPEGAVSVTEDAWGKIDRTPANRPDRQFKILASGGPCR